VPPIELLSAAQAAGHLQAGRIIAYPTEAVYGLGCDPENESAVRAILHLKQRSPDAGLILIADNFQRLGPFVNLAAATNLDAAMATWPGPVTWLIPRAGSVPDWLAGNHSTIAVRVTDHPVARELCAAFGGAIVSTSANRSSEPPALSPSAVHGYFGSAIAGIVAGRLGDQSQPSEIRDLETGAVIRKSAQ
jgi:L-threonylcarbamoyladenylate synthase